MSKRANISEAVMGLTSLGAFVEAELGALEAHYGHSARDAGERMLESLVSDSGRPMALPEGELLKSLSAQGVKPLAMSQAMEGLLRAGLIVRQAPGSLRLSSNALAAALEQRFLGRRTLRREAAGLIRDKYLRNDLLSEKELSLVEPHLSQLNLTAEEIALVSKSRQAVAQRRWALWGAVISVILMLSLLAWNWYKQSIAADEARVLAETKTEEARDSAEVAEQLRREAEALARSLRIEKDTSEARRIRAEFNEILARLEAQKATTAASLADSLRKRAEETAGELEIANRNLKNKSEEAERSALAARDSAVSAQRARRDAEALALILKSRNIALSVPQLPKDSVERKAVLAYQAYAVNEKSGQGDVYNSGLYKALHHALEALRQDRGYAWLDQMSGIHREDVSCIVRGADGSYNSAGTDGKVYHWSFGQKSPVMTASFAEAVQKLAASPDGRWLLICPRLGDMVLMDTQKKTTYAVDYPGAPGDPARWGVTDALFLPEEQVFLIVGHQGGIHRLEVGKNEPAAKLLARPEVQFRAIERAGKQFFLLDAQGRLFFSPNYGFSGIFPPLEEVGQEFSMLASSRSEAIWLAEGMRSGEIGLTVDTFGILTTKQLHQSAPISAEFSPDGRWVATLSRDGVARIIDIERYFREAAAYQPILLDAENVYVTAICFSADSRELLVGAKDGGIRRFYLDPARYARQLCELLHLEGDNIDWQTPWREDFQEKGPPAKCY